MEKNFKLSLVLPSSRTSSFLSFFFFSSKYPSSSRIAAIGASGAILLNELRICHVKGSRKLRPLSKLKFSKVLPYAFTEHGAIMAASVLNSPRAIEASVFIVRAFVKLRREISEHKELVRKVEQLDRRLADHDQQILSLVQAIKSLISPSPVPKRRQIGFLSD